MRSHKEGQSGGCPQDLPRTESATKAAAAAKAEPDGKPKSKSGAVAKGAKRSRSKQSGAQLDLHRGEIGGWYRHSSGPTCVWTSRKGGKIFLAGLPIQQTVRKFPTMALQICCFPHGPETAAYSYERSEQWTDVWPAVKNTVWNGDNVLIHCIKGRHRGAFLAVLCVERCWQVNPLRRRTSTSKHVVGQNSTRCSRTKGRASGFRRLGRRRW